MLLMFSLSAIFTVTATPTNSYHTLAVNVKDCAQATSVMSTTTDCVCVLLLVCAGYVLQRALVSRSDGLPWF